MNIALWVLQVVLVSTLIGAGRVKVFAYEKYKAISEKHGNRVEVLPDSSGKASNASN